MPTPANQFGIVATGSDADVSLVSGGVAQNLDGNGADDTQQVDTRDTQQSDTQDQQPSAELLAKRQEAAVHGWKSREAWEADGNDPSRWRDAPAFLSVREGMLSMVLPKVREENTTLKAKVAALESIVRAREIKEKQDLTRISLADLRTKRREALRDQNWDDVDALDEKILEVSLAERAAPAATATTAQVDPETQAQFDEISAKYPWMKEGTPQFDPVMVNRLLGELVVIRNTPGNPYNAIEAIKEGVDRISRRYPEKFSAAPRRNGNGSSMVDMDGRTGINGSGSHGRTWNDLLPSNRRIAEEDIRRGLYTKEMYLSLAQPEDFRQ